MANFLTQDDLTNWGPELVDFSQRAAAHALGPHLENLQRETAELRRRNVEQRLSELVPNWREIDSNPNWKRWLAGQDALSGQQRQQLLEAAIARGEAHRVVGFFNGFLRGEGGTGSHHRQQQMRPRQSAASKIYSRDEIAKLYSQHRQGRYSPEQWSRLERDIIQAGAEGRIAGALDIAGK